MTTRQAYTKGGKQHLIDDYTPSFDCRYLIDEFWKLKSYAGSLEEPLRRDYFKGTLLDRNERDILLKMDSAFRSELADVRRKNDKYVAGKRK